MRELWTGSVIAALIVGVLVWGLILFPVVAPPEARRRAAQADGVQPAAGDRLHDRPVPDHRGAVLLHRRRAEQGAGAQRQPRRDDRGQRLQVELAVRLPRHRGRDGEPVDTVGNSDEIPILVLPTDRTIRFELASADVIHSFWVPEFLFKLDVIPGNENGRDNVFEVTVDEEGAYVGRCAELCGTYHAFMNFEVRAVSGDDYDAYLAGPRGGHEHVRGARGDRAAGRGHDDDAVRLSRENSTSRPTVAEPRVVPCSDRRDHEEARP